MSSHKSLEKEDDLLSHSFQNLLQRQIKQELKRPSTNEQGFNSVAIMGRLEGFNAEGYPIVAFIHNGKEYRQVARSTVELTLDHADRDCLIQLCGSPDTVVILGLIQPPLSEVNDGTTAIIRSDDRIRLQCGDAYIELSAEGSVRIRGDYVETVAYGANRLKGSSVKIN